jgi:hypothetical protein
MATTTNYSWTTPDDTSLVKDGAAAIRSLGTAIDTTVFTNAGAAVAKATVDAKGDLIAGTADNTVARLAVGANDTVLTADSSTATGLKWATPAAGAAATTLLSTTTLTGTSVTISSIPQTFKHLLFVFEAVKPTSGGAVNFDTAGITSVVHQYQWANSSGVSTNQSNTTNSVFFNISGGASGANNIGMIRIPNYTLTIRKIVTYNTFYVNSTHGDNTHQFGQMCDTGGLETAVSSVTITAGSSMSGTVKLFGVN